MLRLMLAYLKLIYEIIELVISDGLSELEHGTQNDVKEFQKQDEEVEDDKLVPKHDWHNYVLDYEELALSQEAIQVTQYDDCCINELMNDLKELDDDIQEYIIPALLPLHCHNHQCILWHHPVHPIDHYNHF